jgi:6-pyruvoyltetrahydropterin/6-carboxytetrahydropterin synthase
LAFKFVFAAETLDDRNWVADFGGLKELKQRLQDAFDHKTLVAYDDPEIEWFREGHRRGVLDLVEVEATGCEKFAELAFDIASKLIEKQYGDRVKVVTVEVCEHESNSAMYTKN